MSDDDDDDYDGDLFSEPEAFEGLPDETRAAIRTPVTPEQVAAVVGVLTDRPLHAHGVLRLLQREPWWPGHNKLDTQLRRIRVIRDAAVLAGHPVCTTNAGYYLGDWGEVFKAARRCRRSAEGALNRARELEHLAQRMMQP